MKALTNLKTKHGAKRDPKTRYPWPRKYVARVTLIWPSFGPNRAQRRRSDALKRRKGKAK